MVDDPYFVVAINFRSTPQSSLLISLKWLPQMVKFSNTKMLKGSLR